MPAGLADAIGAEFLWVGRNEMDYLVEVADEATLRHLRPHFPTLSALPMRGVIVTCRSDAKEFDFVSRFFAPSVGLNEDPVTGSAHCALGPYWQGKTGKSHFTAYQASERGGVVRLRVGDGTVVLSGQAVMMTRLELRHRTT
jgi:predicted PhzF superfamily epimerase YddE/YHI9